jgi:hypothetical protein
MRNSRRPYDASFRTAVAVSQAVIAVVAGVAVAFAIYPDKLVEPPAFVVANELGERGCVEVREHFTKLLAIGAMRGETAIEFSKRANAH